MDFLVEVKNSDLMSALKHLCKAEKVHREFCLTLRDDLLVISAARTYREIPATGRWPESVWVSRSWAESLLQSPYDVVAMVLEVCGDRLKSRDLNCLCRVGPQIEDEDLVKKRKDIAAAVAALAPYHVCEEEVLTLMDQGDSEKRALWGPDEYDALVRVGKAWMALYSYGVEPSDIRRLLNQKTRNLWNARKGETRDPK